MLLRSSGVNVFVANLISTSIAIVVSLFLNYNYTFRQTSGLTASKLSLFLIITLSGLWIIQPIVIFIATSLNSIFGYVEFISTIIGSQDILIDLIPKLLAIMVTLLWNYALYRKYVFNSSKFQSRRSS